MALTVMMMVAGYGSAFALAAATREDPPFERAQESAEMIERCVTHDIRSWVFFEEVGRTLYYWVVGRG